MSADLLIRSYVHLVNFPRQDEALRMLKSVASMVMPIMRNHGWQIRELGEIYPDQANLLGFNQNRNKICLRLRYAGDRDQFMPMQNVIDTMLHELSHMVHDHHNMKFHHLWDKLRDEYMDLVLKGYTGEGFLSKGQRLGGASVPVHERNRLTREAAEKRRSQLPGTVNGRRLGGAALVPGKNIRAVVADAAGRRNEALRGCGTERLSDTEIRDIADTASANGFRTKAEEDEANDMAIAQALWELVQEEEIQAKHGSSSGGASNGSKDRNIGHVEKEKKDSPSPPKPWECGVCTLQNSPEYLCCDACGTEKQEKKPERVMRTRDPDRSRSRPAVVDLTESPPPKKRLSGSPRPHIPRVAPEIRTWKCSYCGKSMDRQWWTCSTCGRMKDYSR